MHEQVYNLYPVFTLLSIIVDGLQAIILEDGTTAYLATQQGSQLMENATLEPTTLTLDQLTSPNLITNGIVNMNVKPVDNTYLGQTTVVSCCINITPGRWQSKTLLTIDKSG